MQMQTSDEPEVTVQTETTAPVVSDSVTIADTKKPPQEKKITVPNTSPKTPKVTPYPGENSSEGM